MEVKARACLITPLPGEGSQQFLDVAFRLHV
jgi:hypothetical protein